MDSWVWVRLQRTCQTHQESRGVFQSLGAPLLEYWVHRYPLVQGRRVHESKRLDSFQLYTLEGLGNSSNTIYWNDQCNGCCILMTNLNCRFENLHKSWKESHLSGPGYPLRWTPASPVESNNVDSYPRISCRIRKYPCIQVLLPALLCTLHRQSHWVLGNDNRVSSVCQMTTMDWLEFLYWGQCWASIINGPFHMIIMVTGND